MWTAEQRARHKVSMPRERKGYPTDVSDKEWKLVEPLLPGAARTGRPRKTELRQVINALRYLVRSGCEWRMLPNDFPPYQTVYYWFRRLVRRFLFRTIHDLALMLDRMCEQREVVPSAGIVDSQSVKAPGARERGYDAHKKISGRKRHIAVDTDGRLLAMNLTPADIADSTGAQLVLDALAQRWPWVKHLFGDAAYDRRTLLDKATYLGFTIEVVRGLQGQDGFQVQPRRWVVERTFAWLMRYRRLVRDYEQRLAWRTFVPSFRIGTGYPASAAARCIYEGRRRSCRRHRRKANQMSKIPSLPNIKPELLDLPTVKKLEPVGDLDHPPRILMLCGSLRERSFSRFLTEEAGRILEQFGAEVKIFDPTELPMAGSVSETHPKVVELRELCLWSEGQVWCSPERHGAITAVMKNQIDWIPLEMGAIRPSQGRTLAVMQVCGGSQSFNVVNTLRLLGRWMRMFTIPNQSSVPMAYKEFDDEGRMRPSAYYDRVVDVMEELFKITLLMRGRADYLTDRYSERNERAQKAINRQIGKI